MSEPMYRAQILLEPQQRRKLEELAQQQGRSISAITRQVIDAGLKAMENEADVWERRSRILAEARAERNKLPLYTGDLVNETREEREREIDEIWSNGT